MIGCLSEQRGTVRSPLFNYSQCQQTRAQFIPNALTLVYYPPILEAYDTLPTSVLGAR